jgi:hypothetical protein
MAKTKANTPTTPTPTSDKPVDPRTIKLLPLAADAKRAKPGSKREHRFSLYRDGITIDEYVQAGGRRHDVARDAQAGRISVSK